MDNEIKEIATDFIKRHGGHQRRKHLFLKQPLLTVSFLIQTFGDDIFKILGATVLKMPGGGNHKYPKLTYYINEDGKVYKIKGNGIEIIHTFKNNKLIETNSFNEFGVLNDIGRESYNFTGYHIVKSRHHCNSKKQYFYDNKDNLKRIITSTGPEKYEYKNKYIEEWIKNDVIFKTIETKNFKMPSFMLDLNFYLWYNIKSTNMFKYWKHIGKVRNTDREKRTRRLV